MKTEDSADDWYLPGREIHTSNNAFLIQGGEENLLFETLSPANRQGVIETVRELLDGAQLDYIVVSHTEAPHGGNSVALMETFSDASLVASAEGHHHDMYRLDEAMKVAPGDTIDLGGGSVVEFHEAVFADTPMSIWMSEQRTNTLFTVDFGGGPHMDHECVKFIDEIENGITVDRLAAYHLPALPWLRFADTERTDALIEYVMERFEPSIIAPTHGLIVRENPTSFINQFKQMIRPIIKQDRTTVVFDQEEV